MRIGIVGAENSHCGAVAMTMNVDKACGRDRVTMIWGETRAYAEAAAERGQVPEIVRKPEDMIGRIDGAMFDHRHAKYLVPAAMPFVEAGIPCFVDKPFAFSVKEGWNLIQLARKKRVPLTSFSVIPLQAAFQSDFRKQVRAAGQLRSIETSGPCDLKSKWGGVFFYGIHQVDAILKGFGPGIESVQVIKAGRGNPNAVAVMKYRDGGPIVTMHCISAGKSGFNFRAVGEKSQVQYSEQRDPNPYLNGIKTFLRMFRTGKEPYTPAQMLEPVAVLTALQQSVKTGKRVRVAKLPC